MKNLSLRLLSLVALLAILFSSCSKDSLSKPSTQTSRKHSTNDAVPTTGAVQARLASSTAIQMSMVVFDDAGFRSDEVFADQDGFVRITDIPEGTYTVLAHFYTPPTDPSVGEVTTDPIDNIITIQNVTVIADQVTDLGRITYE